MALAGCGRGQPEPVRTILFAMDTAIDLTVYGERAEEAVRQAGVEVRRLEGLFSVTLAESDVARINAADGEPLLVSPETAEILGLALALWAETEGAFSPGLYALQRTWGFTTDHRRVPEDEEIATLLGQVDVGSIQIEGLHVTVPAGTQLDFGAIAKGYAGDRLTEILDELSIDGAILSFGGDVLAFGARPGGEPWRVAIRSPLGDGFLGLVEVRDRMVSTSGSYERQFTAEDGQVYHHILDPETGRPAQSGLVSVSVVSEMGARGDALATALFVMGLDAGAAFVARSQDLEAIFVTEDGRVYASAGLEGVFLPADGLVVNWRL